MSESQSRSQEHVNFSLSPAYKNNTTEILPNTFNFEIHRTTTVWDSHQKATSDYDKIQSQIEINRILEPEPLVKIKLHFKDHSFESNMKISDLENIFKIEFYFNKKIYKAHSICTDKNCLNLRLCFPNKISGNFIPGESEFEKYCQMSFEFFWDESLNGYRLKKLYYAPRDEKGNLLLNSLDLQTCDPEKLSFHTISKESLCYNY